MTKASKIIGADFSRDMPPFRQDMTEACLRATGWFPMELLRSRGFRFVSQAGDAIPIDGGRNLARRSPPGTPRPGLLPECVLKEQSDALVLLTAQE